MRNISLMCLIMLCLFQKTVSAQIYIDLVNTGFSQNIETNYKGFNNKYNQQSSWLHLNIPIVYNDIGDFLMPSLQYNFSELQHDFFEEDKLNYHNIYLGLAWLKNWKNPHWASYVDIGTGVSSDLKAVEDDHFNVGATLLFYYGKKTELVWNFGLNYSGGAFGNYLVPLLGVDWMINDKTTLSFQTFSHLQFDYKINQKFYAGLIAHATPFSFNMVDYNGVKDSYIHTYSDKFPYSPQSIGVYADFYLKNEIALFGKVGYEFAKTLHHEDLNGMTLVESPYQGEISSGLVVEIGVAWRKRMARKFKFQ